MAKELPYYQFEVAEYLAGDIMVCSLEARGLFEVIKCLYWQKECILNVSQVLKRYDKQILIEELEEEKCIKIYGDGAIEISFLKSQYETFKARREKLSAAGKKGGDAKKTGKNKPPLSEVEATPKHIEEKRGEKIILEKNILEENNSLIKKEILDCSIWVEIQCKTHLSLELENFEDTFEVFWSQNYEGHILHNTPKQQNEIKRHFSNTIKKLNSNPSNNQSYAEQLTSKI
jgi:hypothetical protein